MKNNNSSVYYVGIIFEEVAPYGTILSVIGDWPSGKAMGSGPMIGGSNPSSPAMKIVRPFGLAFFIPSEIGDSNTRSDRGENCLWQFESEVPMTINRQ